MFLEPEEGLKDGAMDAKQVQQGSQTARITSNASQHSTVTTVDNSELPWFVCVLHFVWRRM